MGDIDVLINNAGYAYPAEIGTLDVDAMKRVFETNVFGLVDLTKSCGLFKEDPTPYDCAARRRRGHVKRREGDGRTR
jgi:NAD(P)-dependent dehydrogenase (short-subunit alcohol dehydrogenase family)